MVFTALMVSVQVGLISSSGNRKPKQPVSRNSKANAYGIPFLQAQSIELPELTSAIKKNALHHIWTLTLVDIEIVMSQKHTEGRQRADDSYMQQLYVTD